MLFSRWESNCFVFISTTTGVTKNSEAKKRNNNNYSHAFRGRLTFSNFLVRTKDWSSGRASGKSSSNKSPVIETMRNLKRRVNTIYSIQKPSPPDDAIRNNSDMRYCGATLWCSVASLCCSVDLHAVEPGEKDLGNERRLCRWIFRLFVTEEEARTIRKVVSLCLSPTVWFPLSFF